MTCCANPRLGWGVNAHQRCTVFCLRCRHVYERDLKPVEARIYVMERQSVQPPHRGEA